jgi:hypothetical protein
MSLAGKLRGKAAALRDRIVARRGAWAQGDDGSPMSGGDQVPGQDASPPGPSTPSAPEDSNGFSPGPAGAAVPESEESIPGDESVPLEEESQASTRVYKDSRGRVRKRESSTNQGTKMNAAEMYEKLFGAKRGRGRPAQSTTIAMNVLRTPVRCESEEAKAPESGNAGSSSTRRKKRNGDAGSTPEVDHFVISLRVVWYVFTPGSNGRAAMVRFYIVTHSFFFFIEDLPGPLTHHCPRYTCLGRPPAPGGAQGGRPREEKRLNQGANHATQICSTPHPHSSSPGVFIGEAGASDTGRGAGVWKRRSEYWLCEWGIPRHPAVFGEGPRGKSSSVGIRVSQATEEGQ